MCRIAIHVDCCVVSSVVFVAVDPAPLVVVGLKPRAITESELREASSIGPGQQLFDWIH